MPVGYAPQWQPPPPQPQYGYEQWQPPYPQVPPWAVMPPPESAPASAGWAWVMGGLGIGAGVAALLGVLSQRQEEAEELELLGYSAKPLLQVPPVHEALEPPATEASKTEPQLPSAAEQAEAFEELVSKLRQHAEEARETTSLMKKCMQQQQEQYKEVFSEMTKVMQKQQKPQPLELSAASIQTLASLMQPVAAAVSETVEERAVESGGGGGGPAAASLAAAPPVAGPMPSGGRQRGAREL